MLLTGKGDKVARVENPECLKEVQSKIKIIEAHNCGGKNHLARNCRVGKSESTGRSGTTTRNSTQERRGQNSNTTRNSSSIRQVDMRQNKNAKSTDTVVQKELSDLLVSESDDGDLLTVPDREWLMLC